MLRQVLKKMTDNSQTALVFNEHRAGAHFFIDAMVWNSRECKDTF